ncbi:MAG TPA: DUF72 domain-containing protein [Puia sp.]|nr:DUF72 domain-containing protein [Puia sp.]
MPAIREHFFSGTSNIVLPVKNKSFFPPEFRTGTRLSYYASLFNSVEINASFYRRPRPATMVKWSMEVPDSFRFSMKLSRAVTHAQKQLFNLAEARDFMAVITAMPKPGCLLVQLPPTFRPDLVQLKGLLLELKKYDWPVAIEFRHPDWYTHAVFDLLSGSDTALVLHDMRGSETPMAVTARNHVYIRFHGLEAGYRGSYTDDYLIEFARRIQDWVDQGKTVYCYFNNTLGSAVQNLLTLNRLVGQRNPVNDRTVSDPFS